MKYYEITAGSPAYESTVKLWSYQDSWKQANSDIENILRCKTTGILYYNSSRLCLDIVPEHLKAQFCKTTWYNGKAFPAKKNSDIQKKFEEIVKKHGVYTAYPSDIAHYLGTTIQSGKESYYPPMDGRYYVSTERDPNKTGLVEIQEPEFLRLRADWLERQGKTG